MIPATIAVDGPGTVNLEFQVGRLGAISLDPVFPTSSINIVVHWVDRLHAGGCRHRRIRAEVHEAQPQPPDQVVLQIRVITEEASTAIGLEGHPSVWAAPHTTQTFTWLKDKVFSTYVEAKTGG